MLPTEPYIAKKALTTISCKTRITALQLKRLPLTFSLMVCQLASEACGHYLSFRGIRAAHFVRHVKEALKQKNGNRFETSSALMPDRTKNRKEKERANILTSWKELTEYATPGEEKT
ncbi:unnamed protein product [Ceratitis capitata]|uniref:(Mediterranean fruit fly) hypothetical protein n=1 Tax=Ceratitis capitata TaxID=7213 RepID=A0A811V1F1_CERCA|nr:unnamed protein product [Ceratitis capitata]